MNARLFCKTGQLAGADYPIGKEVTIGTAVGNTIQLYPTVISSRHARIFLDEKSGKYMIEDFNSSNGTRVDGMPVRGTMRLEQLNVITFAGSFDFLFQIIDSAGQKLKSSTQPDVKRKPASAPAPTPAGQRSDAGKTMFDDGAITPPKIGGKEAPSPQAVDFPPQAADDRIPAKATMLDDAGTETPRKEETVVGMNFEAAPIPGPDKQIMGQNTVFDSGGASSPVINSQGQGRLYYLKMIVAGESKEILLSEGENYIGREESCSVRLSDNSISRQHACVTLRKGKVSVRDLGSKNHTFVGNEQISQETEVVPGQMLVFGMVKTELIQHLV